jgi:hypothetical protein
MCALMVSQRVGVLESAGTEAARVAALGGVNALMAGEVGAVVEELVARAALVTRPHAVQDLKQGGSWGEGEEEMGSGGREEEREREEREKGER